MITILVALLVFCIVWWVAMRLMAAFGVGDPVATVIQVVLVIIALVWVLNAIGWGPNLPRLR